MWHSNVYFSIRLFRSLVSDHLDLSSLAALVVNAEAGLVFCEVHKNTWTCLTPRRQKQACDWPIPVAMAIPLKFSGAYWSAAPSLLACFVVLVDLHRGLGKFQMERAHRKSTRFTSHSYFTRHAKISRAELQTCGDRSRCTTDQTPVMT